MTGGSNGRLPLQLFAGGTPAAEPGAARLGAIHAVRQQKTRQPNADGLLYVVPALGIDRKPISDGSAATSSCRPRSAG